MQRKKLFVRMALLICFIFLMNDLGGKYDWYPMIWWYDHLMHFLGGLWLGLGFAWLLETNTKTLKSAFKIFLGVFIIGFLWEVYQIAVNDYIAKDPFDVVDSVEDVIFDLLGGVVAIFYVFKRIIVVNK